MRRPLSVILAIILAAFVVSACDRLTRDPDVPSLPAVFGALVTDGQLRIWTGSPCWAGAPCPVTNGVTLVFKPDDSRPDVVELTLEAPADSTVDFERLTLGSPTPGLQVLEALPAGFDWRSQASLMLEVHTTGTHRVSTTDLAAVVAGSAEHPDDTYCFQGVGWLDPAAVADQNGTTFLATCTPDPAKE